jgi:hypothetical protein
VSNHLAFATVTATLVDLLGPVADKAVSGAKATIERPDLVKLDAVGVNVFLYQVTPNAAWRNADLPARRPDGAVAQRPQAAFDLHYLFSFHGAETSYEPQRILGNVVSVLHSQPVLSREMVRDASQAPLASSNLADQVELVRFAPLGLNLEELSKLWSVFFQVPYKLSIAYQASVVLIEPEVTVQPALPVRARNLYVMPFRQPEVDEVQADAGPGLPILSGDTIVLRGRNLKGDATRVRIGGVDVVPAAASVRDDEIRVALPAGLPAGVLGAQVVHLLWMGTPPTLHTGTESNVAPFVLRPKIKRPGPDYDVTVSAPVDGVRTVTVGIEPVVKKEQRIVLLLNLLGDPIPPTDPRAFSAVAEPRDDDADPVAFKLRGLKTGQQLLVRVQVDGAESLLERVDGAYAVPKVTVP